LDLNKTYKNFVNSDFAVLLKTFFLPKNKWLYIHRLELDTGITAEDFIQKVCDEINSKYTNKVYLPIIPLTLPIKSPTSTTVSEYEDVIKNPKWLIRTESLIDEKILGN
jgi:hypothetical protein